MKACWFLVAQRKMKVFNENQKFSEISSKAKMVRYFLTGLLLLMIDRSPKTLKIGASKFLISDYLKLFWVWSQTDSFHPLEKLKLKQSTNKYNNISFKYTPKSWIKWKWCFQSVTYSFAAGSLLGLPNVLRLMKPHSQSLNLSFVHNLHPGSCVNWESDKARQFEIFVLHCQN